MRVLLFLLLLSSFAQAEFFDLESDLVLKYRGVNAEQLKTECFGGGLASSCSIQLGQTTIANDLGFLFPYLPNMNAIRLASIVAIHNNSKVDLYQSRDDADHFVVALSGESIDESVFRSDLMILKDINPQKFTLKNGDVYLYGQRLNIVNSGDLSSMIEYSKENSGSITMTFYADDIRRPDFSTSN